MRTIPKEFISIAVSELRKIQEMEDTEVAHLKADAVLLTLLTKAGLDEIVKEYSKITKYYA